MDAQNTPAHPSERPKSHAGLLEHTPIGFAVLDDGLVYRYVNAALSRTAPAYWASAIGRPLAETACSPGDLDALVPTLRRVLETGEPHRHRGWRWLGSGHGGSDRWLDWEVHRIPHDDASFDLLVSFVDVTDRVTAGRERDAVLGLADRTKLMGVVTDAAPHLMAYVDREERYLFQNRAYEAWFDLPAGTGAGRSVREVLGRYYPNAVPRLAAAFAGQRQEFEVRVDRHGAVRHCRIDYVPDVLAGGETRGIAVVVTDITDLRTAHDELQRRARELERANGELGQFAHAIAHDLQEPIRVVAMYLDLALRRAAPVISGNGRAWVERAREGALRMQRLVRSMLAYSRLGAHDASTDATFTSADALDAAIDALADVIAARGATVTRGPLPEVRFAPTRLAQLFQHLIDNAVKFNRSERPTVHVSAARRGDAWVFSVADDGMGVDARDRTLVFEVFRRLHGYGSYDGTGIGLAICRKIVEARGGQIWVEDRPGGGSVFSFTILDP